ncbi:MAG: Trk system potassium transporter TrkA [Clostridiaceae bacterium]|nr:Trk system potassium transporter TrkA [Clostridiaceae bacterium]
MHIIIVGAGKLGYKLAETLSQENSNVVIIDIDNKALERVNNNLDVLTVKANGVELKVLKQLNIKNFDLMIAVTSSDETNILVSSMAKKLGCHRVMARVRNPEYGNQLDYIKRQMDIDYIANPELETAKEIAKYLLQTHAVHMEDFAKGKVGMVDFRVKNIQDMVGKKLRELDIPQCVLIAAILRNGEIIIPHGDTELLSTDIIYVIGQKESINSFSKEIGTPINKKAVKKALILGGGKAGYYLANKLIQNHVAVKIIERDRERCKYLAEQFPNALVIHGDGTDSNLLSEENVFEMDALISLTGYDEENLLLALLGKQYGINKVIAKVSRPNYIPIIEKLGIDVAMNPVTITASGILRFIQGGRVASLSLLLGGQAEVLEIIAKENSKVVENKLSSLGLPKGMIIGAVVHKGNVIIPDGNAVIYPGDRVIVFCLQSEVASIEKLFYRQKGGLINELWDSYKGTRKSTSI